MRKKLALSLLVAMMLFGPSLSSVNAAVMTYNNETTFRLATPSGIHNPAVGPPVQSFESLPPGSVTNDYTSLTSLAASPFTITAVSGGVKFGVFDDTKTPGGAPAGAHATDGNAYIVTSGASVAAQNYTINFHFNVPVSSFGLWVTDFGDEPSGEFLKLGAHLVGTNPDGSQDQAFTIDQTNSDNGNVATRNANQQFFGVISNGAKFTDLYLVVTHDPIGFDEVYYDTSNVPEPSSLALGAIGLMGLGFWRRKRSAV